MKGLTIAKKLLLSYAVLVIAVSALSVAIVLPGQIRTMNRNLEGTLSRVAYILAYDKEIIDALKTGVDSESLQERLNGISEMTKDTIDYIVVADANSKRIYHPNRVLIGGQFNGGDEIQALKGTNDAYITTWKGHPDIQKRAFHSVHDETGKIIGFVMASTSTKSIEIHKQNMIIRALGFMMISLVTGIFLALGITINVRRILLGYDPTTFAKMYLQREEILDKLREGIFVVNQNLRIIYKNMSSKSYVKEEKLTEDSPFYPWVKDSLKMNKIMPWRDIDAANETFLVSMVPLKPMEDLDAVMVILHNRTEFVSLMDEVTGLHHVVDALRANTHEFRNKLHVIGGLLQLDRKEEAMDYISESWARSSGQNILRLIKDPTIAALLLGKVNKAEELDIDLKLRRDSYLPEKNSFLKIDEMIKIIGNLIENSFEAIGDSTGERQVEFFINVDEEGMSISVDDTGCGMTEEQIQKILDGSEYTSKGVGHGNGMRRIREVIERHNGFLQIESEVGVGTSITVNFARKKN